MRRPPFTPHPAAASSSTCISMQRYQSCEGIGNTGAAARARAHGRLQFVSFANHTERSWMLNISELQQYRPTCEESSAIPRQVWWNGGSPVVLGLAKLRQWRRVGEALQHAVQEARVAQVAKAHPHCLRAGPLHLQHRQLLLRGTRRAHGRPCERRSRDGTVSPVQRAYGAAGGRSRREKEREGGGAAGQGSEPPRPSNLRPLLTMASARGGAAPAGRVPEPGAVPCGSKGPIIETSTIHQVRGALQLPSILPIFSDHHCCLLVVCLLPWPRPPLVCRHSACQSTRTATDRAETKNALEIRSSGQVFGPPLPVARKNAHRRTNITWFDI